MLELNRGAEVAIHGQAADMEWTLERHGANNWVMVVEGVSDVGLAAGDSGLPEAQPLPRIKQSFTLNDGQAAATMALFIGDDAFDDGALVAALYEIAEQVWKDVPMYFRPIP